MNNELLLAQVYRRTAGSFLVFTIVLLGIVAYVVLPKALIVITPEELIFENTIEFSVGPLVEGNDVAGLSLVVDIAIEQTFDSTGEKESTENISGNVTLINNHSSSQPLIRTTRLLSTDGTILKLDKAVTLEPGERLDVPVYLDQDQNPVSELPVGRLSIPGLWEGLQDNIYGEITTPLLGETSLQRVVQTDDITFAQNTLKAKAKAEAEKELISIFNNQQEVPIEMTEAWELQGVEALDVAWDFPNDLIGSAREAFVINGTITFKGVFYNGSDIDKIIEEQLNQETDYTENMVIHEKELVFTTTEEESSTVHTATVKGSELGIRDAEELDIYTLNGLTKAEAVSILKRDPGIKDVKIELTPFWVKNIPSKKADIVILKK